MNSIVRSLSLFLTFSVLGVCSFQSALAYPGPQATPAVTATPGPGCAADETCVVENGECKMNCGDGEATCSQKTKYTACSVPANAPM